MKIISLVIVFLMLAGNVFGKIITSVHGYKYEMPDNYKLVNNINIQDLKKIARNEGVLRLFDAFENKWKIRI